MEHLQLFENFDSPDYKPYDKSAPPRPIGDKYKDLKPGEVVEITGVATRLSNKNSGTGLTNNSRFNIKVVVAAIRVKTDDGTLFLVNTSAIDMESRMNVNKVHDGTKVTLTGTVGRTKLYEPANQMGIMLFKVQNLVVGGRAVQTMKEKPEPKQKDELKADYQRLMSRFQARLSTLSVEDKRAYRELSLEDKRKFVKDYMLHYDKSREEDKSNPPGRPSGLASLNTREAMVLKTFDKDKKYDMSREDFAAYLAGDDRTKYNLTLKYK